MNHLLIFQLSQYRFQEVLLHNLACTKVRLTDLLLLSASFFLLLKNEVMFPFFPQWELHLTSRTSQYNGQWVNNFNHQFPQDPRMSLIRSQGLVFLWGPEIF